MVLTGHDAPDSEAPEPMSEWPSKVANAVEGLAETVRSKALRPLETVVRAIVFGVIIAFVGLVLLIFMAVGTIRVLNVYLFPGQEWASYAIVGGIFGLGGVFLSSRKRATTTRRE